MKPILAFAAMIAVGAAPAPKLDRDTAAWWATTAALSDDSMAGRDTGSAGYERAARLVADRFKAAGLMPAGNDGGWFQLVPMHEVAVTGAAVRVGNRPLRFLHDFTIAPDEATPASIDAPISYGGYCSATSLGDVRGKIVICHGTRKDGLPSAAEREEAVRTAGAAGMLTIADPGFKVEPPRWPYAYARSVRLAAEKPETDAFLKMSLNADALDKVLAGSGRDATALIAAGSAGKPLPSFSLREPFKAAFSLRQRDIGSRNVLAMLPGSDPELADQAILLSAHLDGYGYGEPVNGDRLYNGTLDNAAYVALQIRLAEQRGSRAHKRPIMFAVWTGEEKGLLGSRYYVDYPTVPIARIAANINLDQLRPIFPLELMTVHALDDSTLGDDVRAVARSLGVAVQNDPEPERNLLRRSDHWPFIQAGVPATGFVFGYRPGSPSEQVYRQWYRTGYHKPQDDLKQPIDWKAAADFNRFFYALVEQVADKPSAPAWKPSSTLKPD